LSRPKPTRVAEPIEEEEEEEEDFRH